MFFKNIARKLQDLSSSDLFDPSQIDDPVASRTSWNPLRGGGASFQTRKLVEISNTRLAFRTAPGAMLFYLAFPIAGFFIPGKFLLGTIQTGGAGFNVETLLPLLGVLLFVVGGSCMLYFGTQPVVFDKQVGYFWKGYRSPDYTRQTRDIKHSAQLHQIHALQLISEYCGGNSSDSAPYYSYELNLVLKDGERVNVVDHGKKTTTMGVAHGYGEQARWACCWRASKWCHIGHAKGCV